ncbi:tannase/feruloyl esterase family alpha/beta hydrolase [Pedobacter sp.]|uniref:tannase/feruloyl esterase family alpha/beta hydrolase n=1 Tax=Pedobacter sp. TaxID=1411316 RepID=UPI003BAD9E22
MNHFKYISPVFILLLLIFLWTSAQAAYGLKASPEDSLKRQINQLKIDMLTIEGIQRISCGYFDIPGDGQRLSDLPAFFRIAGALRPVAGSLIKIELWLPVNNWNERFLGTGNGGGAGKIVHASLASGIRRGYATANTDLGTSNGVNSAVGQPEIWKDFGYRATHLMTTVSKMIIKIFYGRSQHHSYFTGCSTGGQQALMEVQRYPQDYDGVIAAAPANNRTHLHAGFLFHYQMLNQNGKPLFSKNELSFIAKRINQTYAVQSGGIKGDNFLTDPRRVRVNFDSLFKCGRGREETCLNQQQLRIIKLIYAGPKDYPNSQQIYTPPPVGAENIGGGLETQQTKSSAVGNFYPFLWALGRDFNPEEFDMNNDLRKLDSILAPILNANNADISKFKNRGGKLIMYTGTSDPLVPYQDALNYYERVVTRQRGLKKTQDFFLYYLIPGMAHCGGGPGLSNFSGDLLEGLVDWVEHNMKLNQLEMKALGCCQIESPPRFTRPVYPYPKFAVYKKGPVNHSGSFIPKIHLRKGVLVPAKKYLK